MDLLVQLVLQPTAVKLPAVINMKILRYAEILLDTKSVLLEPAVMELHNGHNTVIQIVAVQLLLVTEPLPVPQMLIAMIILVSVHQVLVPALPLPMQVSQNVELEGIVILTAVVPPLLNIWNVKIMPVC